MPTMKTVLLLLSLGFLGAQEKKFVLGSSDGSQKILSQIAQQCSECLRSGFLPCGDDDVAYGRRFFKHFFQDSPGRGFLVTAIMTAPKFTTILRTQGRSTAENSIRRAFEQARLIVVEEEGLNVHLLAKPEKVEVHIPKKLHECLQDPKKIWGCCAAACKEGECCEKDLGSPQVRATWVNPAQPKAPAEKITLQFHPESGRSLLQVKREPGAGPLYYCLTQGPAQIK